MVSEPANVIGFSAVAYAFGKYLNDVLDIPIGLIHTSWGGSPAEAWTDEQTLKQSFGEIDMNIVVVDRSLSRGNNNNLHKNIHPINT